MPLPGPLYEDNPRNDPSTFLNMLMMMLGMAGAGGMNPRLPFGRTPTTPGGMRSVRTDPYDVTQRPYMEREFSDRKNIPLSEVLGRRWTRPDSYALLQWVLGLGKN